MYKGKKNLKQKGMVIKCTVRVNAIKKWGNNASRGKNMIMYMGIVL